MTRFSHVPLKKEISLVFVVMLVVVGAIATAGYFYYQYNSAQKLLASNPQSPAAAQQEIDSIEKKVGKIMLLPETEQPTLATVSDVTKLINQPFFARAKNGDKVLIYQNAKKAILYRPAENKIIEVSTINVGESTEVAGAQTQSSDASSSAQVSQAPQEPAQIVIYNGTNTVGLTKRVESTVKGQMPAVAVVSKTNAYRMDYESSVVVVFNSAHAKTASDIATLVGATVGSLPSDETKPQDADILIIAGEDFGQ